MRLLLLGLPLHCGHPCHCLVSDVHININVLLIFTLLAGREKETALAQLTVSKEREARMQVIFLFFCFVCLLDCGKGDVGKNAVRRNVRPKAEMQIKCTQCAAQHSVAVSYTHLTLPTKRIV